MTQQLMEILERGSESLSDFDLLSHSSGVFIKGSTSGYQPPETHKGKAGFLSPIDRGRNHFNSISYLSDVEVLTYLLLRSDVRYAGLWNAESKLQFLALVLPSVARMALFINESVAGKTPEYTNQWKILKDWFPDTDDAMRKWIRTHTKLPISEAGVVQVRPMAYQSLKDGVSTVFWSQVLDNLCLITDELGVKLVVHYLKYCHYVGYVQGRFIKHVSTLALDFFEHNEKFLETLDETGHRIVYGILQFATSHITTTDVLHVDTNLHATVDDDDATTQLMANHMRV